MVPWEQYCSEKILPPDALKTLGDKLRKQGKSIATLNGAFDLLQPGHLYIIHEAALCADSLILLLNSDEAIQKAKGQERPFCPLDQRLLMVSGLKDVSFVSWFEEANPCKQLERIRPDVHINGHEYGPNCIEADVVKAGGGRIHLVDRIGGFSTSKIASKIGVASCV